MAIRGLVFDLFGTLVTKGEGWRAYRELVLHLPPWRWTSARRAALTVPTPTITEFRAEIGVRRGPQPEHFERLVDEGLAAVELFDESIPTLERARAQGLELALLSNLAAPYKRPVFEFGLDRHFDHLVFSCDVGLAKPNPAIYDLVAQELGLPKHELLMVGDTPRDDVRGAKAAGLHALLIDRESGGAKGSLGRLDELFSHPLLADA